MSEWNNTYCNNEHLLFSIVITSIQCLLVLSASNLRGIKNTGAFWRDVFDRFYVNSIAQGLFITIGLIGYSTGST